jgi:2-keto-4-pentenoate hydratase/2-oxohepta-3-ene-1,7-dioic acid hydratase in catechol pathway
MKLASFELAGRIGFGIVTQDSVQVADGGDHCPKSIKDLLKLDPGQVGKFADRWPRVDLASVRLLPPVLDPQVIVGVGLNTKSHFEETAELMKRTPGDYPKYPRLFTRTSDSHVGHEAPIIIPRTSHQLDYEGEIAIVIGKEGRNISEQDAPSHIGGYACYNEGSVRDFQQHSNQVTAGKNFVASGSFGPWLVTSDEVPDPSQLVLETRINGELRQKLAMDDLIFSFSQLISYISKIFHLRPGDVILTGSPAGIGALSKRWLRDGDRVDVTVSAVGTLSNPVVAE